MEQELTLIEVLQLEIEYEEKNYKHALLTHKPIDEILIIAKQIEYIKVTLEAIQHRYDSDRVESSF